MTMSNPETPLAIVYDTLIDLATTADQQAARAAHLDDTTTSSILFLLGDELRTMAHRVDDARLDGAALKLLDSGRAQIAATIARFDQLAQSPVRLIKPMQNEES